MKQWDGMNKTLFFARLSWRISNFFQKHIYGRSGNPTREVLEEVLAAIEKAKYGLCFSTGLSAVNSICHLLKAGDHLLAMSDVYGGVYRMFSQILPTHGLDVEFIDLADPNILHKKVKNNTKVIRGAFQK